MRRDVGAQQHGRAAAGAVRSAALGVVERLEQRTLMCGGTASHVGTHVGVTALDALAVEQTNHAGVFLVTRAGGNANKPLVVRYTVGGTAAGGADYEPLTGTVTIPRGAYSAEVRVAPTADDAGEGLETVVLSLVDSKRYNLGDPHGATVRVADDTAAAPQAAQLAKADAIAATAGPTFRSLSLAEAAALDGSGGLDVNTTRPGSTTVVTPGVAYDVTGGGANLFATADGFRFVSGTVSGDFDVRTQIADVDGDADMAKGGLMARAGVLANDRNVFVGVTEGGRYRFSHRTIAGGTTHLNRASAADTAAGAWVRLKREGNVFTAFRSANGTAWTQVGRTRLALPQTVQLGLAVTSAAADATATVKFRSYGDVSTQTPTPTPTPQPPPPAGGEFAWRTGRAAIQAISEGNGIAVGGKLYIFGGYYNRAQQASVVAQAYDPVADRWTRLEDLPTNRHHKAMATDGQNIYMVGGYNGDSPGVTTDGVWRYNIATDSYAELPDLPAVRGAGAAAFHDGRLHYFGGTNARRYESNEEEHWALDVANPSAGWQRRADLPNARNHLAGVEQGGFIYAVGGMDMDNGRAGQQTSVHRYDPAADRWTAVASLPYGISHHEAFVAEGRIYVLGGQVDSATGNGDPSDGAVMYDPQTDVWVRLGNIPGARKSPVSGYVADMLVAATGNQGGSTPTDTVWSAALRNRWERGASLPAAMTELRGAVIGNRIYVLGEGNASTYAYNLSTATWQDLPDRPFQGDADDAEHVVEAVNGRLYAIGGLDAASGNKVQIFNPSTNAWTLGANMPFSAGSQNSAVINGKIYVAGGAIKNPDYGPVAKSAVYDPATNTWQTLPDMPRARHAAASGTDGQKLYVFGGRDQGLEASAGTTDVQVFAPATGTWTSTGLAPIPRPLRGHVKAVYHEGEFYLFGGETSFPGGGATSDLVFRDVNIYNPSTNTWRKGPNMPTARHAVMPVYHAGRAYVIAGGTERGTSSSRVMEILNLA